MGLFKRFKKAFKLCKDPGFWEVSKFPIYTMTSPDPRCFKRIVKYHDLNKLNEQCKDCSHGYTSFSGVDIRVCFNDKPIGVLQGISFGYITADHRGGVPDGSIGGTCVFVVFDGKDHLEWLGKEAVISLVGANEYGKIATLYHAKVKFDEHEEFGVSIDDIVMEVTLGFTVLERYFTDYVRPKASV